MNTGVARRRAAQNLPKAIRKQRLLEGAREIIRDYGEAALTAQRLAQHAGVSRFLIHKYFRKRTTLLAAAQGTLHVP